MTGIISGQFVALALGAAHAWWYDHCQCHYARDDTLRENMAEQAFTPWITRSRRPVLDCGKFLKVEMHAVELPDGRVIDDWPWVITPDFVNVVAETADGHYLCFRQTKYVVDGTSLAPVGGYLERGEDPLTAAQRELLEETGHAADEWIALGSYPVDANRGAGTGYFFLARGAHRVTDPVRDDLEEQACLRLTRSELANALTAGEFKVLPWATAIALTLLCAPRERGIGTSETQSME